MNQPRSRLDRTLDCLANLLTFGFVMTCARMMLSFTGWEAVLAGVVAVMISKA